MGNNTKKPSNARESNDTGRYSQTERPSNIPSSEPPETPIPQLIKKGYELVFPTKKGDVIVMKKPSTPPEDPLEAYKKKIQWRWWLLGIAGTLVAGGFYASQYLDNFETKARVSSDRSEHVKVHAKIDDRFEGIVERITDIRLEQVRQAEQSKLIDTRLELLLEVQSSERETTSDRDRRTNDIEAERLRREIEVQQERLDRLERNPRVQKAMSDDPLSGLNL